MLKSRRENLATSIGKFLKGGMTIEKISLCVSLGFVLGIFPVLGLTTVLCAVAAISLRLNMPLIQLVNYAVYPLQLLLLAFFYGIGNWLFNNHSILNSGAHFVGILQDDVWGSLASLRDMTLFAVLLWILTGPILAAVLYAILIPVIRKLSPDKLTSISGIENPD
jgi:uncharacterized protein (DUF2062 family)